MFFLSILFNLICRIIKWVFGLIEINRLKKLKRRLSFKYPDNDIFAIIDKINKGNGIVLP